MTKRQYKIFYQLLNMHPYSIQDLCIFFDITIPTLKSEIDKMNAILNAYDVHIYYDAQSVFFRDLYLAQYYFKTVEKNVEMSLETKAMIVLLLEQEPQTLQEIADALYISKSKMHQVSKKMQQRYAEHFKSSRTHGYYVHTGTEEKRQLLVKLLFPYFLGIDLLEEFIAFSKHHFPLLTYVELSAIEAVYQFYQVLKLQERSYISDHEFQKLFLYMCSSLLINQENGLEQMEVNNDLFNNVVSITESQFSDQFAVSTKFYMNNLLAKQLVEGQEIIDESKVAEVKSMVQMISTKLQTGFFDETVCLEIYQYLYHEREMYTKNVSDALPIEFVEIKHKYPLPFEAAVKTTSYLEKYHGIILNEMDRAYLTLFYQKALKKQHKSIDVVIVTPYNKVAGALIEEELLAKYPEITSIETISLYEFTTRKNIKEDALILSMVPFVSQVNEVIPVTPILKESQMLEIKKYLRNKRGEDFIRKLMDESMLLTFSEKFTSKFDIIEKIVSVLEEKGRVSSQYLESSIARENVSSTALSGLAVPHGDTQEVLEDSFCFVQLEQPFIWDKHKVEFVIMIAATSQSIDRFGTVYNTMYRTLSKSATFIEVSKHKEKSDAERIELLTKLFLEK